MTALLESISISHKFKFNLITFDLWVKGDSINSKELLFNSSLRKVTTNTKYNTKPMKVVAKQNNKTISNNTTQSKMEDYKQTE